MRHYIVDGMKKEGRLWRNLMVVAYALVILMPLVMYLANIPDYADMEAIRSYAMLFLCGSFGLYGWIYAIKYHLEITNEKVVLSTLFGRKELDMQQITAYSCKRYGISALYAFTLRTKKKKVVVYTRYREMAIEILKENGISNQ